MAYILLSTLHFIWSHFTWNDDKNFPSCIDAGGKSSRVMITPLTDPLTVSILISDPRSDFDICLIESILSRQISPCFPLISLLSRRGLENPFFFGNLKPPGLNIQVGGFNEFLKSRIHSVDPDAWLPLHV